MHTYTVVVRLKNGSPDLSDDPAAILPPVLVRCKELWYSSGKRTSWPKDQWAFVIAAIEPLLYARIEPEDVHYENGLMDPRGTIQALSVELSSVSFENGAIPVISAYARFQMTFDRLFGSTASFYDWQEQTDWLDWAVSIGFRFSDGSEYDATYEHSGIDLELIDDRQSQSHLAKSQRRHGK